ncbi:tyrosine-type recombinase/integrase [Pseudomonas frederiksbergensis]|nr:tyrosine-type recombinase/integrase [Pseudomonas frederiksbergensis]
MPRQHRVLPKFLSMGEIKVLLENAENPHHRMILRLDPYDGHGMRTKGSKPRGIYISRRFLADLHRYVVQVRGERASLSRTQHKPLFLNQLGEPYADDGKRIERIVREIGKRADIKVHTHMRRHTYAPHTLVALQRNGSESLRSLLPRWRVKRVFQPP